MKSNAAQRECIYPLSELSKTAKITINKDGSIRISNVNKKNKLFLYTCNPNDKNNYLKDKENIREDSGIQLMTINNYKACKYSFIYFDSSYGKDFYCNTVWIETSNYIYILNFEIVSENITEYKDIFTNIKNSFAEL